MLAWLAFIIWGLVMFDIRNTLIYAMVLVIIVFGMLLFIRMEIPEAAGGCLVLLVFVIIYGISCILCWFGV